MVVAREVEVAVDGERDQAADTACTLLAAAEVAAPEVLDYIGCSARVGDLFQNEIPAVVGVGVAAQQAATANV